MRTTVTGLDPAEGSGFITWGILTVSSVENFGKDDLETDFDFSSRLISSLEILNEGI